MAEQGVRMSQYYTSPISAPARSMLLTGNTNQQAGYWGGMRWYDSTLGKEGLNCASPIASLPWPNDLKMPGYNTLMTGKWHLALYRRHANDRGFRHSFAFMGWRHQPFDDAIPLGTVEAFHTYYTRDGQRGFAPRRLLLQRGLRRPDETSDQRNAVGTAGFAGWPLPPLNVTAAGAADEWISVLKVGVRAGLWRSLSPANCPSEGVACGYSHDDTPLPRAGSR